MGFANLKFRDVFSFPTVALAPGSQATGSHAGAAIPVAAALATSAGPAGNYANFRKWVAIACLGSGSTTTLWNAWWGGASASNGTFSMLPSSSTSTFSGSATAGTGAFGSAGALVMEIRGEYINGLNSGITWIAPILSVTNAAGFASILSLAFESGAMQASLYDAAYVLQETDAF